MEQKILFIFFAKPSCADYINLESSPSNNYTDNNKNRTFLNIDIYPTTLGALGANIDGNRLGLGTNLFSSKKTLAEEYGLDIFNKELSKNSRFYKNNILERK